MQSDEPVWQDNPDQPKPPDHGLADAELANLDLGSAPLPTPGDFAASLRKRQPRRRIWTALMLSVLSFVVFLVASLFMASLALIIVTDSFELSSLADPKTMGMVSRSRQGLFILVVLPQLFLVAPALIAAYFSSTPLQKRLSLVRGHWPIWAWFAAAVATPLVGLLSSLLVGAFVSESESLKQLTEIFRDHGTSGFLIPLALIIGLTPALCEELLFRGYVQTRLTGSLHPAVGILIASALFAIFHFDPVHVIAVFPLGIYLGWVSWRSGSIFPAMLGHFVNNVVSVVATTFSPAGEGALSTPSIAMSIGIILLGLIGGLATIVISFTRGRPRDPEGTLVVQTDDSSWKNTPAVVR